MKRIVFLCGIVAIIAAMSTISVPTNVAEANNNYPRITIRQIEIDDDDENSIVGQKDVSETDEHDVRPSKKRPVPQIRIRKQEIDNEAEE